MPKRPPKYSLHKPSGRARVRINGKDIYLGDFDTPSSHERYNEIISKWLTGRCDVSRESLTIARLAIMFVEHARQYYVKDGKQTAEVSCIQMALKPLVRMFGRESAATFGPRKLKAARDEMIRLNWARTTINASIQRINRMFRWASENEYVDVSVYQACRSMTGLRRGRCAARETESVQPAPQTDIDAIELFVSRTVWAMIRLQLVTGMRPGEVCIMRAADIDRSGPVWEYRPQTHKTEHHGRDRLIFIGPKGQSILQPHLAMYPDGYLFPSDPQKRPNEQYERTSYTRAIASRFCIGLNRFPEVPLSGSLYQALPPQADVSAEHSRCPAP